MSKGRKSDKARGAYRGENERECKGKEAKAWREENRGGGTKLVRGEER